MNERKLSIRETRSILNKIPFNKVLGLRVCRMHPDGVTMELGIKAPLRNLSGGLHGGVIASLVDAAVGIAIHRQFGGRRFIATVEMKISYLRPVVKGRVFARSHLLRVGSTLCIGRVDIVDDKGLLIATALATYMLLGVRETSV